MMRHGFSLRGARQNNVKIRRLPCRSSCAFSRSSRSNTPREARVVGLRGILREHLCLCDRAVWFSRVLYSSRPRHLARRHRQSPTVLNPVRRGNGCSPTPGTGRAKPNRALATRFHPRDTGPQGEDRSALRLSGFRSREARRDPQDAASVRQRGLTLHADSLWAADCSTKRRPPAVTLQRYGCTRPLGVARAWRNRPRMKPHGGARRRRRADGRRILVLVGELCGNSSATTQRGRIKLRRSASGQVRDPSDVATMKIELLRASTSNAGAIDNETTFHHRPVHLGIEDRLVDAVERRRSARPRHGRRAHHDHKTRLEDRHREIAQTMITGVGAPGFRRLSVARRPAHDRDTDDRNFPVSFARLDAACPGGRTRRSRPCPRAVGDDRRRRR
jgi:hypothetical protein